MDHAIVTEQTEAFLRVVTDVWQTGLFGIQLGRLLTAAFIFIVFHALRRFVGTHLTRRLRALVIKTSFKFDDKAVDALEQPIMLIPVVLGMFFAFEYLGAGGVFGQINTKLVRSLIVLIIFRGFYNIVDPFSFLLDKVAVVFSVAGLADQGHKGNIHPYRFGNCS